MKEIKVEKDVVLSDCNYYLKIMWNELYNMLGTFDNLRSRETYNRAKELIYAKFLLGSYTTKLEKYIIDFKENREHNIDIDSVINAYNDACNTVIIVFTAVFAPITSGMIMQKLGGYNSKKDRNYCCCNESK